jgi:site-specific DNA-cytosine methylase
MRGIYLAAYKANHPNYDIVYQDINGKRDLGGNMLAIYLEPYDFIIATPPCNFWSNAFRKTRIISQYAKDTAHLLPDIIDTLIDIDKPFIVENVRNKPLMTKYGLYDKDCYIYHYGRHTYWTNVPFNATLVPQPIENLTQMSSKHRQGGLNVHRIIEYWLKNLEEA